MLLLKTSRLISKRTLINIKKAFCLIYRMYYIKRKKWYFYPAPFLVQKRRINTSRLAKVIYVFYIHTCPSCVTAVRNIYLLRVNPS